MAMQKIPKETILAAVEKLGPCQPIDVRKELKLGDTFLIGAMLSEMVADGTIGISKTRRGGSPFYYLLAKPETLETISKYLNEKDRRTCAMLKEQSVMREDAQDPLVRVGLRNIADFSKQMEKDGVVYWRYFLVDEKTAGKLIASSEKENPVEEQDAAPAPAVAKQAKADSKVDSMERAEPEQPEPVKEAKESKKEPEKKEPEKKEPEKKKARKKKSEATSQTALSTEPPQTEDVKTDASLTTEATTTPVAKPAKAKKSKKKLPSPTITPEGGVVISPEEWLSHDTLYERVLKFAGGAQLKEARIYKPHGELTCVMELDTAVGKIDVFIHAFNKKFTDEDVAKSLAIARERCLPLVVLSVDVMSTKARKVLEGKGNISFKVLEN